jgi:bifunctional non-homologous end joining protein LigD
MERFPDGADKDGFFEKRAPEHFPDWVHLTEVETSDGAQEQVVVEDTRTLVFLADQACFTPHTWLSREAHLRQPDQMVFDLDPSTDDLAGVRNATRMVGDLLDDLGLTAFVKTSGSRGYHVLVPLRPDEDFDDVRRFARAVADTLAGAAPDSVTTEHRKAKRGDRVFVDTLRNGYGQTVVPPYAVRARRHAPVSTPLDWSELSKVAPQGHTISSVPRRLGQRADPWQDLRPYAQELGRARERLART